MAGAMVSAAVERLWQLTIQAGGQIEINFVLLSLGSIADVLETTEALNQIPQELVTRIQIFTRDTEVVIGENIAILYLKQTAGFYKLPAYRIKQRQSEKKMNQLMGRVHLLWNELLSYNGGCTSGEERLAQGGDHKSNVPRRLWGLIYYFLLFPAHLEIPTRRLLVLWVAEGLIRTKNRIYGKSVEDLAEEDLSELIDKKLVRVTKKKLNGKPQACSLEDGVRDVWLIEAKEANFFRSQRNQVSRLVDHTTATGDADVDASFVEIHGNRSISNSVSRYGDVNSFMSFEIREGSKPGEDIGNFLGKCIAAERFLWLMMLDLEKVFRPKLPDTLGKLTRLKYLGLRWTYLQSLPDFINKLLQLRVLDVKHTYITVLPRSIWKMKHLRHLFLSEAYRTKFPRYPHGEVTLTHLQTLWGAFIGEDTHVEGGLDTLEHLRKLGLSCRPRSSCQDSDMSGQLQAVDRWVSRLYELQSLRLKSRDKEGEAAHLHLTTLESNVELSTLYLLGKLNPDVVHTFPRNLTDITLSGSELTEDPMQFLGTLQNLQILRLLAKSVLVTKLHCSGGGFLQLKVVYIWCLENLEEWQVDEGSLPCLECFEIRSCPNLKNLPARLEHLDTLNKFWLTKMPELFMQETELKQPLLWAKIEHRQFEDEQHQL